MPKYLGKGKQFFLVSCEFMPPPTANLTREEKIRIHESFCNRCAYWLDTQQRQREAKKKGKSWRNLVCIHPDNKQALQKLSPHITEWAT